MDTKCEYSLRSETKMHLHSKMDMCTNESHFHGQQGSIVWDVIFVPGRFRPAELWPNNIHPKHDEPYGFNVTQNAYCLKRAGVNNWLKQLGDKTYIMWCYPTISCRQFSFTVRKTMWYRRLTWLSPIRSKFPNIEGTLLEWLYIKFQIPEFHTLRNTFDQGW